MNTQTMEGLSNEELEAYAQTMGFTTKACKDKADKIALIQRKRSRSVTVTVLGLDLLVSVRRFRSSKFGDVITSRGRTSAELMGAFRDLLGDDQFDALMDVCRDEDGEPDEDAVAYAFNVILATDELKNY